MALRTPIPDAEEIKVRWGVAKEVLADPNEKIEIRGSAIAGRGCCHGRRLPR